MDEFVLQEGRTGMKTAVVIGAGPAGLTAAHELGRVRVREVAARPHHEIGRAHV